MQILGPSTEVSMLAKLGGGKGRGLGILQRQGVPVPEWAVLGTDVFEQFVDRVGLGPLVGEFAEATDEDQALERAASVRATILAAALPDDIAELIAKAYARIGGGAIAVRSSIAAEDGPESSYAGQFDTFLNVNGIDDVRDKVRACWASAFSPRSVTYGFARGRREVPVAAVVVQRLVDAEVSGVVFTANPMSGASDETVVSSVYGLGEGLVSGYVDADTVVVGRDGAVLDTVIGGKESQVRPSGESGAETGPVDEGDRRRLALTPSQVTELVRTARGVAEGLDAPQDIEWAVADDQFWFLQTRPITSVVGPPPPTPTTGALVGAGETVRDDDIRIWDNSNIIESFSGITSPLTYTTAADIYGRVYRGYAESLRVPKEQLAQTDQWTPVMLGYFHGRVYYNLIHWYRMVGIAPGYPLNRKVLEAALGVAEPLDDALAKSLRPFTFRNRLTRLRSRVVTTITYVNRLRHIDAIVDDFLREFYRVYDDFEKLDLAAMTGPEAYRAYREVDRDLVARWGPLMVLDAILLTLTGSMYLLTKALLPRAPEWFLYAVVGPGAGIESAEPARAMSELARLAHRDPDLRKAIDEIDVAELHEELLRRGHTEFRAAVDQYLTDYGYRSLDELKLEVPDLREEPSSVYLMIRSALAKVGSPAPVADPMHGEHSEPTQSAQDYLDEHLSGVRRRIYDRVRTRTARCAAQREQLRFCRTRAFGMVKRLIRQMGRDLQQRGVIDEFTDVFELTIDELRDCYAGASPDDMRDVVTTRRAHRAHDATLVAPERFVTTGSAFDDADLAEQGWVPIADLPAAGEGHVLTGTPSAAGVVEGTAVVVAEPHGVDGGILVAYRTDPGWVAALPSASALIIERGSPLTHVAIVARELGLPTVVQLRDATSQLRTGMRVRVDGTRGTVTILSGAASPESESNAVTQ